MMVHYIFAFGALFAATATILDGKMLYPENMKMDNCMNDGIYWKISKGEMIPCSPTCGEVYMLNDTNNIAQKTINGLCKLNTEVGKFYHDIAPRDRCVCINGAAYRSSSKFNILTLTTDTKWYCVPPTKWIFTNVGPREYQVTCGVTAPASTKSGDPK